MASRKPDISIIDWVEHMRCTKCLEYKPSETYPIRNSRLQPYRDCVLCRRKKSEAWRKENPHKVKISLNNYRIIHRDEVRERKIAHTKKYYEENKEEIKAKMRAYTKTEHHYKTRKALWRKGYDIGDNVMFNGQKFRIIWVKPYVGYIIQRYWSPVPITVSRKKLTPIKQVVYE